MRGSFRGPDETLRSHFGPHRRKISTRETNGRNRCSDMLALLMRLSIVPTDVQCVHSTLPTLHAQSHIPETAQGDTVTKNVVIRANNNETTQYLTADAVPLWYRKCYTAMTNLHKYLYL